MNAEEFDKLLNAHLDKALDSDGYDEMERAMHEDRSRRPEFEAHNRLTDLLLSIERPPVPDSLRQNIMAKVREEAAAQPAKVAAAAPSVSFIEVLFGVFRKWQFQAVATTCLLGAVVYSVLPNVPLGEKDGIGPRIAESQNGKERYGIATSPITKNSEQGVADKTSSPSRVKTTGTPQPTPLIATSGADGVKIVEMGSGPKDYPNVSGDISHSLSTMYDTNVITHLDADVLLDTVDPLPKVKIDPLAPDMSDKMIALRLVNTPAPRVAPVPASVATANPTPLSTATPEAKKVIALNTKTPKPIEMQGTPLLPKAGVAEEQTNDLALKEESGVSGFLQELEKINDAKEGTSSRGDIFQQFDRERGTKALVSKSETIEKEVANVVERGALHENVLRTDKGLDMGRYATEATKANDDSQPYKKTAQQTDEYTFWSDAVRPETNESAWLNPVKPNKTIETAKASNGLSALGNLLGDWGSRSSSSKRGTERNSSVRSFGPALANRASTPKPAGRIAPASARDTKSTPVASSSKMMSLIVYLPSSPLSPKTSRGGIQTPAARKSIRSAGTTSRPTVATQSQKKSLSAQQIEANLKKAGVTTSLKRTTKGYVLTGQIRGKDGVWVASQLAKLGIIEQRRYPASKTAKGYYIGSTAKKAASSSALFTFSLTLVTP